MREGWGLTTDDSGSLYATDGTATLFVLCAEDLASADKLRVTRRVEVSAAGRPLGRLNDLQWVRGELWANIWGEDRVAVINPHSGEVRCFVDLSGLLSAAERRQLGPEEVLNGIAYDAAGDRLFVTGKCWPKLFEIDRVE